MKPRELALIRDIAGRAVRASPEQQADLDARVLKRLFLIAATEMLSDTIRRVGNDSRYEEETKHFWEVMNRLLGRLDVGDGEYWPAADFPWKLKDTLRKAISLRRGSKRVRSRKEGNRRFYNVEDVKRNWPWLMQGWSRRLRSR
jgi:hypothetical protein